LVREINKQSAASVRGYTQSQNTALLRKLGWRQA